MPVKIILRTCIFIIFCVFANANETVIEIENPKFTEKGINEKVYEIKASKGLQSEEKIDLINIEGKFRTESGVWIYLTADNGLYKGSLIKFHYRKMFTYIQLRMTVFTQKPLSLILKWILLRSIKILNIPLTEVLLLQIKPG